MCGKRRLLHSRVVAGSWISPIGHPKQCTQRSCHWYARHTISVSNQGFSNPKTQITHGSENAELTGSKARVLGTEKLSNKVNEWCLYSMPFIVSTSASDWLERLVSEMTYNVLMGTLNPNHSLTHSLTHSMPFTVSQSQSRTDDSSFTSLSLAPGWRTLTESLIAVTSKQLTVTT